MPWVLAIFSFFLGISWFILVRKVSVDDREWAEQFPEELLIKSLGNSECNRNITLHQLGLQEDDVIIRERDGIYFYFRRKRK